MVAQLGTLGQHHNDRVQGLLASWDDLIGRKNKSMSASVTQFIAVD